MKREIEHRWRELGEFLREQRRLARLSLRRLSELSGISNPYLSQIERGLRRPSAEILQQLAKALQISAETLYVRAGILEDRSAGDDVVTALRKAPELNEEQKRTLIHIYQSFRAESGRAASAAVAPASTAAPATSAAPVTASTAACCGESLPEVTG